MINIVFQCLMCCSFVALLFVLPVSAMHTPFASSSHSDDSFPLFIKSTGTLAAFLEAPFLAIFHLLIGPFLQLDSASPIPVVILLHNLQVWHLFLYS